MIIYLKKILITILVVGAFLASRTMAVGPCPPQLAQLGGASSNVAQKELHFSQEQESQLSSPYINSTAVYIFTVDAAQALSLGIPAGTKIVARGAKDPANANPNFYENEEKTLKLQEKIGGPKILGKAQTATKGKLLLVEYRDEDILSLGLVLYIPRDLGESASRKIQAEYDRIVTELWQKERAVMADGIRKNFMYEIQGDQIRLIPFDVYPVKLDDPAPGLDPQFFASDLERTRPGGLSNLPPIYQEIFKALNLEHVLPKLQ